jgi:tetratricopeptide (TPR) repeat protein
MQVEANLNQELQQLNQKLRSLPTTPQYEFIFDFSTDTGERTSGSRAALEQALAQTQQRLILICPWSAENRLDGELLQKLQQYLRQNRRLDLGWCFQAKRDEDRLLSKLIRGWEVVPQQRNDLQTTLRELLKMKQAFPDRFQFKVLGTAENFLVSDQNLAIVGIPDTLSTNSVFTQLQLKLRTTDPKVVQRLIHQFDEPVLEPTDLLAHWNRAVTCYELGDRQGAINDFTHILSLNPEDAIAYNYRGIVRSELNDTPGAIADFTQALQLNPRLIAASYNRGFLHLEMGNQLAAIADFSLAIQLQPDAAIAYFYRGLASQKLGDLQGAIKDYSVAIQLSPTAAVAYYYRGVTYQKLENLSDAIADLETAARLFNTLGSKNNVQKALHILTKLRSVPSQQPVLATAAAYYPTSDGSQQPAESDLANGDRAEALPESPADQIQVVDVEVLSPELVIDPVAAMRPAQSKRSNRHTANGVLVSDNGLMYTVRSSN